MVFYDKVYKYIFSLSISGTISLFTHTILEEYVDDVKVFTSTLSLNYIDILSILLFCCLACGNLKTAGLIEAYVGNYLWFIPLAGLLACLKQGAKVLFSSIDNISTFWVFSVERKLSYLEIKKCILKRAAEQNLNGNYNITSSDIDSIVSKSLTENGTASLKLLRSTTDIFVEQLNNSISLLEARKILFKLYNYTLTTDTFYYVGHYILGIGLSIIVSSVVGWSLKKTSEKIGELASSLHLTNAKVEGVNDRLNNVSTELNNKFTETDTNINFLSNSHNKLHGSVEKLKSKTEEDNTTIVENINTLKGKTIESIKNLSIKSEKTDMNVRNLHDQISTNTNVLNNAKNSINILNIKCDKIVETTDSNLTELNEKVISNYSVLNHTIKNLYTVLYTLDTGEYSYPLFSNESLFSNALNQENTNHPVFPGEGRTLSSNNDSDSSTTSNSATNELDVDEKQ